MRTLLIRPGAIGDCILSFPVLEHLRTAYTEVWVPSAIVPLIQFADHVRSIFDTGLDTLGVGDRVPAPSLLESLQSFDRIISWYGANRPEFRQALLELAPNSEFHCALPPLESEIHATDFLAQQVGAPLGLVPRLTPPEAPPRNAVVIQPFSGSARKNWPLDSFRQLAQSLRCPVEWCAGPEEQLPGANRFENLLELAYWLRGARLYIGNDSGITHLAAAAGTPVVALFGPTNPNVWAPREALVIASKLERMPDLEVSRILLEILPLLA